MTNKTNLINWAGTTVLWVLSVLMFPSCQKSTSGTTDDGPPESAILDACKKESGKLWGGGNVSDIVRGSPLPSDKRDKSPSGTLIYPVRVVYSQLQEQPFVWDPITKLPRPGDWKAASVKGEFHFVKNEFNEWKSELIRSGWLSPAPGPVINDPGNRPAFHEAYKKADIEQLESLLRDSQSADEKSGNSMSHETKLLQFWLESARDIQKSWEREERQRTERQNEEQENQRLELERRAEYEEAAKKEAIQEGIAAEEREAERLYAMGWVGNGRDGRTIDEFMFQGEWKYPQQARAAMERAKAQEEQRIHAESPKRLAEYRSGFDSAKEKRDQRMREEIEYQKQRTLNPERYPDQYKHFFYPGEIKAWQKAQDAVGSGALNKSNPTDGEKPADQLGKEQVARVQAESEGSPKQVAAEKGRDPHGVEKSNNPDSVDALRKKAANGGADAQYKLGRCYYLGEGVVQNHAEGLAWFRKAAEQGNPQAQFALGYSYGRGEGVKQDLTEAAKWMRRSAEQGDPNAQCILGQSYLDGLGVAKDEVEAVKWFTKGSQQGHAESQTNLGMCYAEGNGVPKSEVEAVKWFRKAAETGDATAQCILGCCYQDGRGVPEDRVAAYAWLNLSAASGYSVAIEQREEITSQMTKEEIAEGQKLSREWQSKRPASR